MPYRLSRIQLLWHRFWPPPAPAKASAPRIRANPSSPAGNCGEVTVLGSSPHASAEIATATAPAISSSTSPTLANSTRSSAVYTTGARVSPRPITSSMPIPIQRGLPPAR